MNHVIPTKFVHMCFIYSCLNRFIAEPKYPSDMITHCEMLQNTCDVKTWVQIQRSPRSMSPCGVTGQPWVNVRLKKLLSKNSALSVIINNRVNIFALITYQSTCSCESRSRDIGFHPKLDVSWDFSAAISHRIKASAIGLRKDRYVTQV